MPPDLTSITIIPREERRMKDPLTQAERSKFTFVDLLSEQNEKFHTYWVESAVWFPSVKKVSDIGVMPPSYVPEIVLTEEDLQSTKYSIEKIFDYYCMYPRKIFTKEDYPNLTDTNTFSHAGYVIYNGIKGYYYRAYMELYAKDDSGSAIMSRYTGSMLLS